MERKVFTFNPFQENTYVVWDPSSLEAMIVDPGCYGKKEENELLDFVSDKSLKIKYLINTHAHVDHVLGNYCIRKKYPDLPHFLHEKDIETLKAVEVYAPMYGFQGYQATTPTHWMAENDEFSLGMEKVYVIFAPGHAPGHVVLYVPASGFCLGGDVLFYQSIGRTDLPGGNHAQLISSIREKLFVLPNETVVCPGHGPETNIGFEKKNNPYCAIA